IYLEALETAGNEIFSQKQELESQFIAGHNSFNFNARANYFN
ncbi:7107_t:CDS:1, partial [Entrophospora sp. SA101]